MATMKEIALEYAEQGFAVFPVRPRGKEPAISAWKEQATTDETRIAQWWEANPLYNIGIATGAPSGGLVVIDLDVSDEGKKNGLTRLSRWQNENGVYLRTDTATARTGSGGVHLFFRDAEVTHHNVVDLFKDGSGVDVRADGGYVVAPGSTHPNGNKYEWIRHPRQAGVLPATAAVRTLLSPQNDPFPMPFCSPEVIGEGERNSVLFKLACSLVAKGLTKNAVHSAVAAENEEKCVPPLPNGEIELLVSSAMRYPSGTSPYQTNSAKESARALSTDLIVLSATEEKEPEWLVEEYIPRREITIMAGDGGAGKTFAWCAIAAAVSSGRRCFLQDNLLGEIPERVPEKVLFFSSEDSFEYVLRRRLRKNGADLNNILTLDCTDDRFPSVTLNSDYLEQLIAVHRPALCVFDPLQAFVGGANMISRSEMRECMKRLHAYGDRYGTAFLIVMHTNKMQGVWGRNRLSDSSDIWDIARSVMIVGKAGETSLRYLSHEKSNYGPQGDTVLYDIIDDAVRFQGYTDKQDRDFVQEASKRSRETPAADEAREFVLNYLGQYGGNCEVGSLDEAAKAFGISANALRSAKKNLRISGQIRWERVANGQGKGHQWRVSLLSD